MWQDRLARFRGYLRSAVSPVNTGNTKQQPLALTSGSSKGYEGEIVQIPVDKARTKIAVRPGTRVNVTVYSSATSSDRAAALFQVMLYDAEGLPVEIAGWRSKSEKVGQYFYLKSPGEKTFARTDVSIPIPNHATHLELRGRTWKRKIKTYLLSDMVINVEEAQLMENNKPDSNSSQIFSNSVQENIDLPTSAQQVALKFRFSALSSDANAPIKVTFLNERNQMLPPYADLPQSPALGPYLSLIAKAGETVEHTETLTIPEGAATLLLEGVEWGKKMPLITDDIEVSFPSSDSVSVVDFIRRVPIDDTLLIIDTTAPPLGHKTLSLRPNNLTMAYERLGAWVIFVPFGSIQDQSHSHSERVYQIDRKDFDVMIQSALELRSPKNSYFICSSFPSFQSVTAVNLLKTSGWNTLYECRDDMEEFNRVGYSKWYSTSLERAMVLTADQTISVSSALDEKLAALAPGVTRHSVVPNAVNRTVIDNGASLRTLEALDKRQDSTVVGYVGHLTDSWFDWPLIEEAASRLPHITFEIIGHGAPDNLSLPANVKMLGAKSHDELPEIVAGWKVALIPFKDLPLTRSVDPNKIYEYFAWGLRCVSAPMGLVHEYPSTWVYRTADEFVDSIREAVETKMPDRELYTLDEFVQTASWDDRAVTMFEKLGISINAAKETVSNA